MFSRVYCLLTLCVFKGFVPFDVLCFQGFSDICHFVFSRVFCLTFCVFKGFLPFNVLCFQGFCAF